MLGGVDPAEGGMCWDQPGSTLSWYPGWVLLYPSYVEVENSSLVLRQFWRLTEVPPDLDTDTLSGSESGFCHYLKDFLPYLLTSLSD